MPFRVIKIVQFVIVILSSFCNVRAGEFAPCKMKDYECQLETAKMYWRSLIESPSSTDSNTADPMQIDKIEDHIGGLNVKFTDVVIVGLKDADVESWRIDFEKSTLQYTAVANAVIKGNYSFKGNLLVFPIEGDGGFTIKARKLKSIIKAELKLQTKDDGKEYYQIPKYSYVVDPIEVNFRFDNLFNGNERLSESVHAFMNNNHRDVINEIGKPMLDVVHKKIIKQLNKFLRKTPKDELFIE